MCILLIPYFCCNCVGMPSFLTVQYGSYQSPPREVTNGILLSINLKLPTAVLPSHECSFLKIPNLKLAERAKVLLEDP